MTEIGLSGATRHQLEHEFGVFETIRDSSASHFSSMTKKVQNLETKIEARSRPTERRCSCLGQGDTKSRHSSLAQSVERETFTNGDLKAAGSSPA